MKRPRLALHCVSRVATLGLVPHSSECCELSRGVLLASGNAEAAGAVLRGVYRQALLSHSALSDEILAFRNGIIEAIIKSSK